MFLHHSDKASPKNVKKTESRSTRAIGSDSLGACSSIVRTTGKSTLNKICDNKMKKKKLRSNGVYCGRIC